jgi:tetratricopeptide (TPR) repeat protein
LGHFEKALELNPDAPIYGNNYRLTCIRWHEFDRCIDFFDDIVVQNEGSINARFHLALAYVDKMPWYMFGMVQQGQQSNLSMEHLTKIIEQDSTFWGAWYGRGMNHLHWPRMMRHAPDAIADFKQALELQNKLQLSQPKPHFELTYLGLGDAYVKDLNHAMARNVWQEGLALFPHSAKLRRRLSIADDGELEEFVKVTRSLKKPIETDMWMIWAR